MQHTQGIQLLATLGLIFAVTAGCDRARETFSRATSPADQQTEAAERTQAAPEAVPTEVEGPRYIIQPPDDTDDTLFLSADTSEPVRIEGDVIGRKSATEFGSTCAGFIEEEPTFTFEIEGDAPIETAIAVLDSGGIDTTLVLDGPGGARCDDDSGGNTLPRLRAELQPGLYTVYIGAYLQNQGAHFQASIGPGQPRFDIADCDGDRTIDITEAFDEQNLNGSLTDDLRPCKDGVDIECDGYLSNQPGPCVEVAARQVVKFTVTEAAFDSVMVLQAEKAADSAYNDDGFADMRSEIVTVLEPGRYALHVGAYEATSRGEWTVNVTTLDIETDANGEARPMDAVECDVLEEGEVLSRVGTTTPEIDCGFFFPDKSCIGTIPMRANHCIEVSNGMSVDLEITEANFDTVLLVSGDSLFLSDDDGASGENLLSKLSTPLPSGVYQIFVGSIDPRQAGPYRLQITPR